MAIGTIQTVAAVGGTGTSVTTAAFTPNAAGMRLFAYVSQRDSTAATVVTDSTGLTWTKRIDTTTGAFRHSVWTADVATPAAMTVTAQRNGTSVVIALFGMTGTSDDFDNFAFSIDTVAGDPAVSLPSAPAATSTVLVLASFAAGAGPSASPTANGYTTGPVTTAGHRYYSYYDQTSAAQSTSVTTLATTATLSILEIKELSAPTPEYMYKGAKTREQRYLGIRMNASLVLGPTAVFSTDGTGGGVNLPVNTEMPVLSGYFYSGKTLSISQGTWSNNPVSYSYAWKRVNPDTGAETAIGTDQNTYTVTADDEWFKIRCYVTATNANGSTTAIPVDTGVIMKSFATLNMQGDSVGAGYNANATGTDGDSNYAWAKLMSDALGATLTNQSQSGFTMAPLTQNPGGNTVYQSVVNGGNGQGAGKRDSILVVAGGNDAFAGATYSTAAHFKDYTQRIITKLISAGYTRKTITLGSMYPVGDSGLSSRGITRSRWNEYQAALLEVATEFGIPFFNMINLTLGSGDMSNDNIHPTRQGHQKLASESLTNTSLFSVPNRAADLLGLSSTGGSGQFTANWTAYSGATQYQIRVSDRTTGALVSTTTSSGPSTTVGGLSAANYYVQVRAVLPNGAYSPWSQVNVTVTAASAGITPFQAGGSVMRQNSGSATTPSFTPEQSNTILYAVVTQVSNNVIDTPSTVTDSSGLTWTKQFDSGSVIVANPFYGRCSVWTALVTTPSAITVTANIAAALGGGVTVMQMKGGQSAITNAVVGVAGDGKPSATLPQAPASTSTVVAVSLMSGTAAVPTPTDWTLAPTLTVTTPYRFDTFYDQTSPAQTISFNTSNNVSAVIMFEIKQA